LKCRLGARVYSGPASQLVQSEPPAPAKPVEGGPGPLSLMAKRAGKNLRRLRRRRKGRERKAGRMPFRPHRWFGKRRKRGGRGQRPGHMAETLESRRRGPGTGGIAVVAAAMVAMAAAVPNAVVLADDHEPWREEIDFELTEPVEGRRLFVERLSVTGDRAAVALRAAADLDIRVRAFGGPEGTWLRFWSSASLEQGERIDFSLPLHGPVPSFTFSWTDTLGQAGAVTVNHEWIPYPLPEVEGELCSLRLASLGWTAGAVSGVVESACVTSIEHLIELQTVAGHKSVSETALMEAEVTAITGTVSASTGASTASIPLVAGGETRFRLPVSTGEAIHAVSVDVSIEAALSIHIPPLTVLTHHTERTEERTETVSLYRPGASDSDSDSETITVTHDDGATTEYTVSAYAYAYVPGRTIDKDVTLTIVHPEHVKAEVVERDPVTGSRKESLALTSRVRSDEPFAALVLPEPEPEDPPAEQSSAEGLLWWFDLLGWEWPW
ncbi:MAG: hypothetical protein OXE50_00020, partial [Chloroflexi bacterium]|nr:hypothetical protein [Chloroflexota bacterium]